MIDRRAEIIQIFLEISLSISNDPDLDLKGLLKSNLRTILRKLNCSAGGFWFLEGNSEAQYSFESALTVPRSWKNNRALKTAISCLPARKPRDFFYSWRPSLPIIGEAPDGGTYHILDLCPHGAMVIVRHGAPFDQLILHDLTQICNQLSAAITRTNQQSELVKSVADLEEAQEVLRDHRNHLEALVADRTLDLKKANAELTDKNRALEQALTEIKTLQGILPICSVCKKIRDDEGMWEQLESYIQEHSSAAFSHALCPTCMDGMYEGETWYKGDEPTDK